MANFGYGNKTIYKYFGVHGGFIITVNCGHGSSSQHIKQEQLQQNISSKHNTSLDRDDMFHRTVCPVYFCILCSTDSIALFIQSMASF
mmetsp:Transcript_7931/g.11807  ORF Transcript_7931/g.11807 Transcript_7931/m.11807 type:complete len:88 (+) Transcript_7931:242-505(+)